MARTLFTANEAGYYGYIPPHGVDLGAGDQVTVEGDLITLISAKSRGVRRDPVNALLNDMLDGVVTIEAIANPSSSSSV
jgi:hypothetical protein